ncbi:MAG: hypothetical protein ACRDKS_04245 [Actinomycetota bacterium]
MAGPETLHDDLLALGFHLVEQTRRGDFQYAKKANRYLTYHVHWDPDGEGILFTWEFAVGEFFDHRGMQIGSNEALNLFLFPQFDSRGASDVAFIAAELDRVEQVLRSLNFVDAEA